MTERLLENTDAAIFLANAQRPLTKGERDLLQSLKARLDQGSPDEPADNLFVLVNFMDLLRSQKDKEQVQTLFRNFVNNKQAPIVKSDNRMHFVSARSALEATLTQKRNEYSAPFDDFVSALETFLVEDRGEWRAVSDRLGNLSNTIYRDVRYTLDKSEQQYELDFLFPELSRIRDHDLVAIDAWQNHIDWYQELSGEELKQLNAVVDNEEESAEDSMITDEAIDEMPAESVFYEDAKSKFVPEALYESLVYSFDADARRAGEAYIAERAMLESLTAFSAQNLRQASPLTVANLELYFAVRDESLVEDEAVEATVAAVA